MMGTKMKKGIFNGLRYFAHIFDPKEHEMQIGYPTDVKHVAHIGWDGPSVDHPSWMNEFRSAPLTATVTDDADAAEIPKFPSSEFILPETKPLEKPSRRKKSSEKPAGASPAANSPKRDPSKHSRRRRSSASSSGGDSADGSRRGRRELRERNGEGPLPGEHDPPGIPKQSRRRRTKGSSSNSAGGESSRPRSRTPGNPDQGILEEPGELLKPVGRPEEVAA